LKAFFVYGVKRIQLENGIVGKPKKPFKNSESGFFKNIGGVASIG
jgi:hypothetical protein